MERVVYGEFQMSVVPTLLGAVGVLVPVLLFVAGCVVAIRLAWRASDNITTTQTLRNEPEDSENAYDKKNG